MGEKLIIKFTPTKDDYIKAFRALAFRYRALRIFFIVLGILTLFGLLGFFVRDSILSRVNFLLFGVYVVFFMALSLLISPLLSAQKLIKNERIHCETIWELDENEILIKNKYSQSTFDWGTFDTAIDTKDNFIFVFSTNERMVQILPKRAFESPEKQEELQKMLKEHFGSN